MLALYAIVVPAILYWIAFIPCLPRYLVGGGRTSVFDGFQKGKGWLDDHVHREYACSFDLLPILLTGELRSGIGAAFFGLYIICHLLQWIELVDHRTGGMGLVPGQNMGRELLASGERGEESDESPLAGNNPPALPHGKSGIGSDRRLRNVKIAESVLLFLTVAIPPDLSASWFMRFHLLWKVSAFIGMLVDSRFTPTKIKYTVCALLVMSMIFSIPWLQTAKFVYGEANQSVLPRSAVFFDHVGWICVLLYPVTTWGEIVKFGMLNQPNLRRVA